MESWANTLRILMNHQRILREALGRDRKEKSENATQAYASGSQGSRAISLTREHNFYFHARSHFSAHRVRPRCCCCCWLLLAAACCCRLLLAAAAAAGCCWLLLAAAGCCCCCWLLLPTAGCCCCCWLLLLLPPVGCLLLLAAGWLLLVVRLPRQPHVRNRL